MDNSPLHTGPLNLPVVDVHEDAIMDCSMTRFQPLGVRMDHTIATVKVPGDIAFEYMGYEEGASVVETSIRRNLMLKYKDDLLNRVTAESALWTVKYQTHSHQGEREVKGFVLIAAEQVAETLTDMLGLVGSTSGGTVTTLSRSGGGAYPMGSLATL